MSEKGVRITFEDEGPYLLPLVNVDPVVRYLPEEGVALIQCANLYIPVSLDACAQLIESLLAVEQVDAFEDVDAFQKLELPGEDIVETPLLTAATGAAKQLENIVILTVHFDGVRAVLPLSIKAAADIGQALSTVPTE